MLIVQWILFSVDNCVCQNLPRYDTCILIFESEYILLGCLSMNSILPSNMFDVSVLYCRCMVMIFHSIDGAVTI